MPVDAGHVTLRAYRPGDEADLLAGFADAEVARWSPGPTGPPAAAEFMARRKDWSEGDQADAEVGYRIGPWARRKGHATRAVIAASWFVFARLGVHRLSLYHAVGNPHSCAVARAAGFLHEGTLRQSFRYAGRRYHDEHLHGLLAADITPGSNT